MKKLLLILLLLVLVVGITGCERPSTIAPVSVAATEAPVVKAVTPTLLIKTPVKVATQASGFQEILSATQTAVATIRSGTLTATAGGLSGLTTGTPVAIGTPGIGTPGVMATPMALGTIYPGTTVFPEPRAPQALPVSVEPNRQPTEPWLFRLPLNLFHNFPVIKGVATLGY